MEDTQVVKKVVIGIPNEGLTKPESYDNHLLLSFHLGRLEEQMKQDKKNPRYEFHWHTVGRLLTAMARERILTGAVKEGIDYVIMYDDDMILPIDMVEAMLTDMEEHPEIDILAPLAFMRNPPHSPVIYISTEGYDSVRHQQYFHYEVAQNYPKNTLVECDAVGFGAVCIKADILKKMKEPYCFSTTGSGEDVYFCSKAKKEAGARVFMDTRIKLGHLSNPKIIDEDYREQFIKEHGINYEEKPYKYLAKDRDE